jgi:hypothetical protein
MKALATKPKRLCDKIFAMEKRGDGRISLWCKAPPGSQIVLVGADPDRFFVPPYVGHKGWIGMQGDQASTADAVRECPRSWASAHRLKTAIF